MASEIKPGGDIKVTISKSVKRAAALKTIERLFMMDKEFRKPLDARTSQFKDLPKRRGGRIWTKRPNKIHANFAAGTHATIKATPQHLRDLKSVEEFVKVAKA